MRTRTLSQAVIALLGWTAAIAMFFPILWTLVTSFKSEEAAVDDQSLGLFKPTLDSYVEIFGRADYWDFAVNSVIVAAASTLLALVVAIPAAYAMAFHPTRRVRGLLLWMLSTKMLPPVGVLMPIYIIYRTLHLIDTRVGLIMIDALMNIPLIVWMLFTFFKDIPGDILEAGRMDGAGVLDEIRLLLLPLALPGIAATTLLSLILSWNEGFWSLTLTASAAAPLAAFIASFASPEGLYFAKLSAASTLAVAPILLLGWLGQRHLVQGLTFGAVK